MARQKKVTVAQVEAAVAEAKGTYLYRQRVDGKWSGWQRAELGIPSLLAKAQHRDDYEVERVVSADDLLERIRAC